MTSLLLVSISLLKLAYLFFAVVLPVLCSLQQKLSWILDLEEKKSFGGNQTSLLLLLVLLLSDIMLAAMKKLQNAAQPFSPVLEMREIYFPNREKYSFQTKRNMFIKL